MDLDKMDIHKDQKNKTSWKIEKNPNKVWIQLLGCKVQYKLENVNLFSLEGTSNSFLALANNCAHISPLENPEQQWCDCWG